MNPSSSKTSEPSKMSESRNDPSETLKKLYITLKQTQGKLSALQSEMHEPIAIVGMGCRLPGGADTPQQYWELLIQGKDAVTDVPMDRWNGPLWYDEDPQVPGRMFTTQGGFLTHPVDRFDAAFFNISPKEAMGLDPQQRLLLEVSREAFENAGIAPSQLKGKSGGVFIGMSSDDYALAHRHSGHHEVIDAYAITGTTFSTACGRISYVYGLEGPSMTIDTACSSALTAIHLACQSLRDKSSDIDLAGGVNLMLSPESHVCFSKLKAISPDGRCRSFSAAANGYVRGEGCGLVVLKRLSDAIKERDRIIGVIRGSAVNQDGRSNGLTAPNGTAQVKVIQAALNDAGLSPDKVSYIETHGTGTPLGDPIEAEALGTVFAPHHSKRLPVVIGACKTNIGHLEPASGVAALIKVLLSFEHGTIPANLHFDEPNPHIPWQDLPFVVPRAPLPWNPSQTERIAGVNAFGFSGTNVHLIVSEPPRQKKRSADGASAPSTGATAPSAGATAPSSGRTTPSSRSSVQSSIVPTHHILPFSAKTPSGLETLKKNYLDLLENGHVSASDTTDHGKPTHSKDGKFHISNHNDLGHICRTAALGRDHFQYRSVAVGADAHALIKSMSKQDDAPSTQGKTAFLFTGQGSQYPGMGKTLFKTHALFRKTLSTCDEILKPVLNTSLISLLFDEKTPHDLINQTRFTQPALFALEYALYMVWRSMGITPDIVMGHSVGEYVAACASGIFSLEEGLRLISRRAELMQSLPAGGGMATIMADAHAVETAIADFPHTLSVAAYNGPNHTVIAGTITDLETVCNHFESKGTKVVRLKVSHAFHSQLMSSILDEFESTASTIRYQAPDIPVISNVSGEMAGNEIQTPTYWRNHIRKPVRFQESMETLQKQGIGIFLEIGPKPILLGMGRTVLSDANTLWLPSLRMGQPDWSILLSSLGKLYTQGVDIDWNGLYPDGRGYPAILPTTPFDRRRFWMPIPSAKGPMATDDTAEINDNNAHIKPLDTTKYEKTRTADSELFHIKNDQGDLTTISKQNGHPLIHRKTVSPLMPSILFETRFDLNALPFLDDHRIFQRMVVSAASHLSLLHGAAQDHFRRPGCVIEDTLFTRALIIPEARGRTVQLIFTPAETEGTPLIYHYQIISFTSDPERYQLHASGRIRPQNASDALHLPMDTEDITHAWSACTIPKDPREVYQLQSRRSIQLGDSYRWIESIRTGSDLGVCRLRVPKSVDPSLWGIHPGLIDSCFGLMVMAAGGDSQTTYIPFALEGFSCYRSPLSEGLQAMAKIHKKGPYQEEIVGEITLYDQQGVVAQWKGLEGRQVDPEALFKDGVNLHGLTPTPSDHGNDTIASLMYDVTWKIDSTAPQDDQSANTKKDMVISTATPDEWLILSDTPAASQRLSMALTAMGAICHAFSWSDLTDIGLMHHDGIQGLIQGQRLKGVVHLMLDPAATLVSLNRLEPSSDPSISTHLERIQQPICGHTMELVQVMSQSPNPAQLFLVTCGAQQVTKSQSTINAHAASVWGLGRVIALEHPELNCRLLDLDPDTDTNTDVRNEHEITDPFSPLHSWRGGAGGEVGGQVISDRFLSLDDDAVSGGVVDGDAGSGTNIDTVPQDAVVAMPQLGSHLLQLIESGTTSDNQFAIRQGERYVARLQRYPHHHKRMASTVQKEIEEGIDDKHSWPTGLSATSEHEKKIHLHEKICSSGTYLITGGLGGLGLTLTRWLVDKKAGCVVLAGRSAPKEDAKAFLKPLEKEGGTIEIRSVDLTDPGQIRTLLEEIKVHLPPLKGIIHAAGVLHDGLIRQLGWNPFWEVMAPKVTGAWVLDQETRGMDLDFFICFSSMVSVMGAPAQSNYAAANAFLDALCRQRHLALMQPSKRAASNAMDATGPSSPVTPSASPSTATRCETTLSINWGPFSDAGMAARLDPVNRRRITSQGFQFLPLHAGVTALEKLIFRPDASQVVVMAVDWSRFMSLLLSSSFSEKSEHHQIEHISGASFLEAFHTDQSIDISTTIKSSKSDSDLGSNSDLGLGSRSWQTTLQTVPDNQRFSHLLTHLRKATADVLGLDKKEDVPPDGRLFDLGLDSLMAVELKNSVEKQLGIRLKSTLVFDYPTTAAMATHLLTLLPEPKSISTKGQQKVGETTVLPPIEAPPKEGSQEVTMAETIQAPVSQSIETLSEDDAEKLLLQELNNLDLE